jgi:hypothetical protein
MMRSMLADQPYFEVTTTQGVFASRLLTLTSVTAVPSCSFHHLVRSLYSLWGRERRKTSLAQVPAVASGMWKRKKAHFLLRT